MNEGEKQLRIEHSQLHDKRLYFLLAAAGTSIGFAVTQIDKVTEGPAIYLLVASIALLGFSFLSGMMCLSIGSKFIEANVTLLQMMPKVAARDHEELRNTAKEVFEPLSKQMLLWRSIQIWTLFVGGLALPIWKLWMCDACIRSFADTFK